MLTSTQLKTIDKHLHNDNWLLNNALIAELTDHYVDAISDKLAQNVSFELAIQDVHRSFGGRVGLLRMEENYLATKAHGNLHLYWNTVLKAFRVPGIGYTSIVYLGCYLLFQTGVIAQAIEQVRQLGDGLLVALLLLSIIAFVYIRILLNRQLRAGTFTLNAASPPPASAFLQSGIMMTYLLTVPQAADFVRDHPHSCSLLLTLLIIHNWAWMRMSATVFRRRRA